LGLTTTGVMLTQATHPLGGGLLHSLQRLLARAAKPAQKTAQPADHSPDDPGQYF
jgi:hypothetical protein